MQESNETEKILLLERGKRGLLQIVFGRTTIIILLLLLQVLLFFGLYRYLNRHVFPYTFLGTVGFSLILTLVVVNRDGNPTVKISWLVLILVFPILGGMLYLFVGTQVMHRILVRQEKKLIAETDPLIKMNPELTANLKETDPQMATLAAYMAEKGRAPAYEGCDVTYFPLGEAKLQALLQQLEEARSFIFLEYFIVEEGYMWGRILEVLERKVREGVEVRLLYDGTCAVGKLPYHYPEKLKALGIQCRMFNPLRMALSTHYNNRDHRKIVVIDGHTAFTGGVNLADEYINRKNLYGHWKDAAIMVKGPAVRSFTLMFLRMWAMDGRAADNYARYLPPVEPVGEGRGLVIPYGDSPLDHENTGELVYMDILNTAQRYVHIMTPYLILDNEMVTALTFAAKRGVDVTLLLPHIPDKSYVFALARGHYAALLKNGVKIYEYTPGFVHAKVFVSDDRKAVVGSINLDYRSLYLHFECAAYLYNNPVVADIEDDFQSTLSKSQKITPEFCRRRPLVQRLTGQLLRLFAPLM